MYSFFILTSVGTPINHTSYTFIVISPTAQN